MLFLYLLAIAGLVAFVLAIFTLIHLNRKDKKEFGDDEFNESEDDKSMFYQTTESDDELTRVDTTSYFYTKSTNPVNYTVDSQQKNVVQENTIERASYNNFHLTEELNKEQERQYWQMEMQRMRNAQIQRDYDEFSDFQNMQMQQNFQNTQQMQQMQDFQNNMFFGM